MKCSFSPLCSFFSAMLIVVGLGLVSPASAAPFIDDFANTDNISTFGDVSVGVSSNTLTASRTAGSTDSGIDWNPGGPGNYFSLAEVDSQFIFSLDATAAINGGFYNVSVLLWDASDIYLGEVLLQGDTNSIGTFSYNVATAASLSPFPAATQWSAHMRILPFISTDAGFEFQNFEAVPEPATLLLASSGLIMFALRRRRA